MASKREVREFLVFYGAGSYEVDQIRQVGRPDEQHRGELAPHFSATLSKAQAEVRALAKTSFENFKKRFFDSVVMEFVVSGVFPNELRVDGEADRKAIIVFQGARCRLLAVHKYLVGPDDIWIREAE